MHSLGNHDKSLFARITLKCFHKCHIMTYRVIMVHSYIGKHIPRGPVKLLYPMYLLYNQLREPLITVAFTAKTIFWVFLGKIKL